MYIGGGNWIDWMKALGMFFIVWGHLSPAHLKDVIYAFNVPCFFIISGFLFKDTDWSTFWKKNIKGLVVPYALLCATVIAFFAAVKLYFGGMEGSYLPLSILACLIGDQNGIGCGVGCQALWFVYTLFLSKIVVNAVKNNWLWQCVIIVSCMLIAYCLKRLNLQLFSSYVDFVLAYPFFLLGYFIAKKVHLDVVSVSKFVKERRTVWIYLSLAICMATLFVIGNYNGMVRMYNADYGKNLVLLLFGGCIGTVSLAIISMQLGSRDYKNIILIHSKGSMITLAWQVVFLFAIDMLAHKSIGNLVHDDLFSLLLALFIYLTFVPIIKFVSRYLPVLVGYRR